MGRQFNTKLLADGVRNFIEHGKVLRMPEDDKRVMLLMAEWQSPLHAQPAASHTLAARFFAEKIYRVFGNGPREGFPTEVQNPEQSGVRIRGEALDSEQIRTMFGNHDEARFLTSRNGEEIGVMFSGGGGPIGGISYMAATPEPETLVGYDGAVEEMWIQGGDVSVSTEDEALVASTGTTGAAPESDRYLYVSFAPGTTIRLHVKKAAYTILRWTKAD